MLSFELLKEVQEYILQNLKEELSEGAGPEETIAKWNARSPEKHNIDVPECFTSIADDDFQKAFEEEVANSHYNPDTDFPIPTFIKFSAEPEPRENTETAEVKGESEKEPEKEASHKKGRKHLFTKIIRNDERYSLADTKEADPDKEPSPHLLRGRRIPSSESFGSLENVESEGSLANFEDLEKKLSYTDESFTEMLFRKIDEKGISDADCYHKAQLNRSHFNKIKNERDYHVQKETVIALALALNLDRTATDEFLTKAGYALSPCSKFDLIIEYCISKGIYDVIEVNQLLYAFDQKLLGAGIRE